MLEKQFCDIRRQIMENSFSRIILKMKYCKRCNCQTKTKVNNVGKLMN
jgi:hypothetical protein